MENISYASYQNNVQNIGNSNIIWCDESNEIWYDKKIFSKYKKNQKTILIEDLATDGRSKVIFIEALRKAELLVSDIFVVFYYDIFDINNSPLSSLDVKIHSLCTWKDIINFLKKKKIYSEEQIHNLEKFLQNPGK